MTRFAAPQKFTGIGGLQTRDDLHHRRFAGAVLPHQQMNFAGFDGQVPVAKCNNAAEALLNSSQLEEHVFAVQTDRIRRCTPVPFRI